MESASALPAGSRYVDHFTNGEDYEELDGQIVEDVEYVILDLGIIEPTLVPNTSTYRIVGLDTMTPFLQLSGTVFKGEHQSLLGTELILTESSDDKPQHAYKGLVHLATAEKRIRFKEVQLKEKKMSSRMQDTQLADGSAQTRSLDSSQEIVERSTTA